MPRNAAMQKSRRGQDGSYSFALKYAAVDNKENSTMKLTGFGETMPGYDVPVLNEREVRAAAGILFVIASGKAGFEVGGFAANGFGDHSPGKYGMNAALLAEFVMTFFFLIIIVGATHPQAPKGFAPIAIGLGLTLIHLVSIPVTNTSVNPARSTGPALVVGGWALQQLWLFWVAPIAGAVVAGVLSRTLWPDDRE